MQLNHKLVTYTNQFKLKQVKRIKQKSQVMGKHVTMLQESTEV